MFNGDLKKTSLAKLQASVTGYEKSERLYKKIPNTYFFYEKIAPKK